MHIYVLGSVLLWFHFNCNLKLLFQKYYESTKIYIDICGLILPSRKTLTHLHFKYWFNEWRQIKYIHGLYWVWSPWSLLWIFQIVMYNASVCMQNLSFLEYHFFNQKNDVLKCNTKNSYFHLKNFFNTIYDLILHLFTVFPDYYFNKI